MKINYKFLEFFREPVTSASRTGGYNVL